MQGVSVIDGYQGFKETSLFRENNDLLSTKTKTPHFHGNTGLNVIISVGITSGQHPVALKTDR